MATESTFTGFQARTNKSTKQTSNSSSNPGNVSQASATLMTTNVFPASNQTTPLFHLKRQHPALHAPNSASAWTRHCTHRRVTVVSRKGQKCLCDASTRLPANKAISKTDLQIAPKAMMVQCVHLVMKVIGSRGEHTSATSARQTFYPRLSFSCAHFSFSG